MCQSVQLRLGHCGDLALRNGECRCGNIDKSQRATPQAEPSLGASPPRPVRRAHAKWSSSLGRGLGPRRWQAPSRAKTRLVVTAAPQATVMARAPWLPPHGQAAHRIQHAWTRLTKRPWLRPVQEIRRCQLHRWLHGAQLCPVGVHIAAAREFLLRRRSAFRTHIRTGWSTSDWVRNALRICCDVASRATFSTCTTPAKVDDLAPLTTHDPPPLCVCSPHSGSTGTVPKVRTRQHR